MPLPAPVTSATRPSRRRLSIPLTPCVASQTATGIIKATKFPSSTWKS